MSFKPLEVFVFFILPFIAGGVCRWFYVRAPKWQRYLFFGGLGALALWLWWESPTAEVRSGVVAMYFIIGIPTLLIAWIWPALVRLIMLPFTLYRKLSTPSRKDADRGDASPGDRA